MGRLSRSHLAWLATAALAAAGGVTAATAMGSPGATSQVATIGDVSGTPDQSICPSATLCTYASFSAGNEPGQVVPFDGTVIAFSVNSGSATGTIELRILRPLGNGQYTAVASSAPATLTTTGVSTFTTSLPVKAGDLLGLDDSTGVKLFDDSSIVPDVQYFQPGLADGQSAAPNQVEGGYRMLLAATVQSAASSTTTGTTPGTTTPTSTSPSTPTRTSPPPSSKAPRLGSVHQTHASWTEPPKSGKSGRGSAPVGTTFNFTLDESAQVRVSFSAKLSGRRVGRRCVATTSSNSGKRACARSVARGAIVSRGHAGSNHVAFTGVLPGGKRLASGRYVAQITATRSGRRSGVAKLRFTILAPR